MSSPSRSRRAARQKDRDRPPRPTMRETAWYWIKAIVAILLLRAFVGEPFRIPSESMEETLLVKDFLLVSKLHWGPRTPATAGIPVTGLYSPVPELPQIRLPGFSAPERGDVVVFNYPASRDVERGEIPASVPIERRTPYIKRLIGMPGDTLAVLDKVVHINGAPLPLAPTMKQFWEVTAVGDDRPNARQIQDMGIELVGNRSQPGDSLLVYVISASPGEAEAFRARDDVATVGPFIRPETERDQTFGANPDHVSPRVIPADGLTITLTPETLPIYAEAITRHEGRTLDTGPDGGLLIDGEPATAYTFTQDYYMALGDSRDNSIDSRYWGFVPHSHLVGKAVITFLSFERWLPPIPRFSRFFRPIP